MTAENRKAPDGKTVVVVTLIVGFMLLIALAMVVDIKDGAQRIIDAGLGSLGTCIGAAVLAYLRDGRTDEKRADNSGKALDLIGESLKANPPNPANPNQLEEEQL